MIIGWYAILLIDLFNCLIWSTINFHHWCNLIGWTLSKLVDLALTLVLNWIISSLGATWVHGLLVRWVPCNLNTWLRTTWASAWGSHFSSIALLSMLDIFGLNILEVQDFLLLLAVDYNIESFAIRLISLLVVAFSSLLGWWAIISVIFMLRNPIMRFSVRSSRGRRCRIILVTFPSRCPFFLLACLLELLNLVGINCLILTFGADVWVCTLLTPVVKSRFLIRLLLFEALLSFIVKLWLLLRLLLWAQSWIVHIILAWVHKIILHGLWLPLFCPDVASYLSVVDRLKFFRHLGMRWLLVFQSILHISWFKMNFWCWLDCSVFLRIFDQFQF